MRNQEYSLLYQEYRSQVVEYNAHNERIIKTKFEMEKLWKYKKEYPGTWKEWAEKLTADRQKVANLKMLIRDTKSKMKKSNVDHPQN
jgi:cyclopropane fatty-acyl-phospholipid synthase-like methyltransferase